MKLMAQKWIAAGLLACVGSVASATTLNFDELTGTRYFSTAPSENPYNGFNFACSTNCDTGSWFHSNDNSLKNWYKSPFTSVSTTYGEDDEGFPIYGESPPITSVIGPVIFNGAYFTSGSGDVTTRPIPRSIRVRALLPGRHVHTSAMLTLYWDDPATFLASGYGGPVTNPVQAYQGYFAMDDFEFQRPRAETLALALAALAGVGATTAAVAANAAARTTRHTPR
jgi:hypothetical protein